MHQLCDKYAARTYVKSVAGEAILIPVLGIYDQVEDIDWDQLPQKFVMKVTHGSGWNILCRDKTSLNKRAAERKIKKWLRADFYKYQREWAYKGVQPKIICEQFLSDEKGEPPADYKFFCFRGAVKMIQVDSDRFSGHNRALYDAGWKRMPCSLKYQQTKSDLKRPDNLDEMIDVAQKLAGDLPFVRVDLYSLNNQIYFGEMTMYPGGGLEHFHPRRYDKVLGDFLILPEVAGC
jgi:hypothetical protein